jgi:hypothetical protein
MHAGFFVANENTFWNGYPKNEQRSLRISKLEPSTLFRILSNMEETDNKLPGKVTLQQSTVTSL